MSRMAAMPLPIPDGVEVRLADGELHAKGKQGEGRLSLHAAVRAALGDAGLSFSADDIGAKALVGTMRALARNLLAGVHAGFERKLELVGVGYRAQLKGRTLVLQLGFSHPIEYPVPDDIKVETPSQTEIVLKGVDKQRVGQVAAELRGFRPPEPYKGKGVRYAGEQILRKEAKKK